MTDQLLEDLKAALGQAYLIERELLGGGMSRVFVAREHALGREVVIKVLPPELAAGINRDRFRREIQLAAQISHPYIVPLLSAGESGELLWFTMPYISGDSLRTRLETSGPLPVRQVIQLLRDVVEALAYAHARGVIHRDIKPANILTDGVHALVTDFGVAKALGAALPLTGVAGHTTSGVAIGTPAYMAPEQLAADPVADHRVDIYAVGLLAYELLTGASPFAAPSPTATMTAQLTRTPVSLSTLRSDVPHALAELVERCLAKSPDHRPANAQSVLADLDRISGALAADAHREDSGERTNNGFKPASPVPLLLSGMALVALVVAGFWWSNRGNAAPAASPESVVVQGGSDSPEANPLPANRPLTRADSLAIAAALRDELERIDPTAARRVPATTAATAVTDTTIVVATLAQQLSFVDSAVRVRLAAIASRGTAAAASAEAERMRGGAVLRALPGTERRTVMVMATGRGDATLGSIATTIAGQMSENLSRSEAWAVVLPAEAEARGEADQLPADALVTVAVNRVAPDSLVARIGVRNLTPGSQFGFHMMASDPFAESDGVRGYRNVIDDAMRALGDLRRLERGQEWSLDFGRGAPRVPRLRTGPDSLRPPTPRPPEP